MKSAIPVHALSPKVLWLAIAVLLLTTLVPGQSLAGPKYNASPEPFFSETSIFLEVQGIGGIEVPAVISNNAAYVCISEVFDFLKIKNVVSAGSDSISGFFITQDAPFLIDKLHSKIFFKGNEIQLQQGDFFNSPTCLYMKSNVFGSVFGLECAFNFRSMSIVLSTKLDLPAFREIRQEMMHQNLNKLRGKIKADTVIKRNYPVFRLGIADWSVVATQRVNGINDNRVNLSLGAMLLGGETNVSLTYNDQNFGVHTVGQDSGQSVVKPFNEREQYYRWRYVNNSTSYLRQIIVGKLVTQSISSVYSPVLGLQFTNTPTTYRRSFGSYTISNHTEPGWTVELYVNNELVDYQKADASGFYTFQIPLVYGNSVVKLRYYGPWGEERSREENVTIPFNFLPKNELEYIATAGIVQDTSNHKFGRAAVNYGLSRRITIGTGFEYLSALGDKSNIPFASASLRISSALLLSGEYAVGVRAKGIALYRLPAMILVELDYIHYEKGQIAINNNFLEERRLMVSKSFSAHKFSLYSRLMLDQIVLPETYYSTGEWLLSGTIHGVGANFTTYAVISDPSNRYLYSNLSMSFRLPWQTTVMPQVQYDYSARKLISMRCELGKYLFRKAYVNAYWEQNFKSNLSNLSIGLRYDLSFSQVSVTAMNSNDQGMFIESARGSLIYDNRTSKVDVSNRMNIGTGGIIVIPYLDLNNNGHKDKGEPKVDGLVIAGHGGRVTNNLTDTSFNVMGLESYSPYFLDMRQNSFDNIAWQLKYKTMSILIEPNSVKWVNVPVVVVGEASGMVYLKSKKGTTTLSRMVITIFDEHDSLAAHVVTDADGYFNYFGLLPGSYTISIDKGQLEKLHLNALPLKKTFVIHSGMKGDVIEGIDFTVEQKL